QLSRRCECVSVDRERENSLRCYSDVGTPPNRGSRSAHQRRCHSSSRAVAQTTRAAGNEAARTEASTPACSHPEQRPSESHFLVSVTAEQSAAQRIQATRFHYSRSGKRHELHQLTPPLTQTVCLRETFCHVTEQPLL